MLDFFGHVLEAIVGFGIAGGGFWLWLGKGLDAKFAQLLENHKLKLSKLAEDHKANLAARTHEQNTVFSRIYEQRADLLQKIAGQIALFRWEVTEFSPKNSYLFKSGEAIDPTKDLLGWHLRLNVLAQEPARTAFGNPLLLPNKLNRDLIGWHGAAKVYADGLFRALIEVLETDAYKRGDDAGKRSLLLAARNQWSVSNVEHLANVSNATLNALRHALDSVDRLSGEDYTLPIKPLNTVPQSQTDNK